MEAKLLKNTRWDGVARKSGDTLEIDATTGQRWLTNGIAEPVAKRVKPPAAEPAEPEETDEFEELDEDTEYTVRELRDFADEYGIEIPNGSKKSRIVELINAGMRRATEGME